MDHRSPRSGKNFPAWGWALFIVILGGALYLPSIAYSFVFDDHLLIEEQPAIRSVSMVLQKAMEGHGDAYRPVRTLSYALDYAMGGLNPAIYHVSNIAYHMAVLGILWLVYAKIVKDRWTALLGLGIFALHPVHLDAVAYISGRRDILSALFALLAIWAFLKFQESRRWAWWIPVLGFTALSFGAKEMGAVVPLVVLLLDWKKALEDGGSQDGKTRPMMSFWRALRQGWPYYALFTLGGVFVLMRLATVNISGRAMWWGGGVLTNFLTVAKVHLYYIACLAAPLTLRPDYSYSAFPVTFSPLDPLSLMAAVGVAVLLAALWLCARKGRTDIAFWGVFYLGTLIPVSHIIPHHELMAEHYLYLPSVGFCALAAIGLRALAGKRKIIAVAAGGCWGGILVVTLLTGMGAYRSEWDFSHASAQKGPACIRANLYLGETLFSQGDWAGARPYFERIVATWPEYEKAGIPRESLLRYSEIDVNSGGEEAHRDLASQFIAHKYLAKILDSEGNYGQAASLLKRNLRFGIRLDDVYTDLGNVYVHQGDFAEAEKWFLKACRLKPSEASLWANLGAVQGQRGDFSAAVENLRKSVSLDPAVADNHYNLAMALLGAEAPVGAVRNELQTAIRLGLEKEISEKATQQLECLK